MMGLLRTTRSGGKFLAVYGDTTNNSIFGSAISPGTNTLSARACAIPSRSGPLWAGLKY